MTIARATPPPAPQNATNKSTTKGKAEADPSVNPFNGKTLKTFEELTASSSTTIKNQTMKQAPPETDKDHGQDSKKFAQLPAKTQELEVLQHEAEKSTGQARVALDKLIEEKSKQKAS